jgi:hypothetical protein
LSSLIGLDVIESCWGRLMRFQFLTSA